MGCTSWVAGVPLLLGLCKFIAFLVSEPWKFIVVSPGANMTACFTDEAKTV